MAQSKYQPGDKVVYCKPKFSNHPGPRAKNVDPAPYGETYAYRVDKFWIVEDVYDDGTVMLATPGGKHHTLHESDLNLRPATWLEKILHRKRFAKTLINVNSDSRIQNEE